MEKNLSKDLLLQNLNSENSFASKACAKQICEELLKGRQGQISIQDIVFSQKSNFSAEEFFKMLSTCFANLPREVRNTQKWDDFFNILEQQRGNIPIAEMQVLELYLSGKLTKEEKHKCCFWLYNHCRLGNHQKLILKMLSHPEDGKLMLLANKYLCQEYYPNMQELEKICALPFRTSKKLEAYSLFLKQGKQKFNFAILKSLLQDLSDSSVKITAEEKRKIWKMIIPLLQNNPLDEIGEDISVKFDMFSQMYQENKINKDTYLDILDAYARQIAVNMPYSQKILNGYYQILIVENHQEDLPRIKEILFSLLEMKNSRISDQILSMMLKIMSMQKENKEFKLYHLPEFKAKIYKHVMSVKKLKVSVLKQCLNVDENLFLQFLSKNIEGDIKSVLKEVVNDYPTLWDECINGLFFGTSRNILPIMQMVAELFDAYKDETTRKLLWSTMQKMLNNLPEKEKTATHAAEFLSFMQNNAELRNLAEKYVQNANITMANYLIG